MIYPKLREILPRIDNPVIVEIGAHLGTDTQKIAKLLNKPFTYLAIEPDKRNYRALGKVCAKYGIILVPLAVGYENRIVPFWLSGGRERKGKRQHTDSSSLKKPIQTSKRPPWVEFERSHVACNRLDWIFSVYNLEHIDLIWMDVQGAESDVVQGGPEALKNTDYIYTECQSGRYEGQPGLKGILGALPGWKVVLQNGENVLLRNVVVSQA